MLQNGGSDWGVALGAVRGQPGGGGDAPAGFGLRILQGEWKDED